MKVLFVYLNATHQEYIPLGVAYLSAALKKAGHRTALFDGTFDPGRKAFEDCVRAEQPDLLAFSIRSPEATRAKAWVRRAKEKFHLPVLVGGVHATVAPQEVLRWPGVDFIGRGEGEHTIVEFCNAFGHGEIHQVPGIGYTRRDEIVLNAPAPLAKRLDSIPLPDRELFDLDRYLNARDGRLDVLSGRGCPFGCNYCINHFMHGFYSGTGSYVRMRTVDAILDEIESVRANHDVRSVEFVNDLFAVSIPWLEEFAEAYPRRIGLPFVCNARPEMVSPRVIRALKAAGCVELQMGIESGSPRIRREIMGRKVSDARIIRAFHLAAEAGIRTYAFNMTGVPTETEADYAATVALNQRAKPDFIQVSTFQPYPGTKLYKDSLEHGWIKNRTLPRSHRFVSIMRYPHMSSRRIRFNRLLFRYRTLLRQSSRKALEALTFDVLSEGYGAVRHLVPSSVKKAVYHWYARLQHN